MVVVQTWEVRSSEAVDFNWSLVLVSGAADGSWIEAAVDSWTKDADGLWTEDADGSWIDDTGGRTEGSEHKETLKRLKRLREVPMKLVKNCRLNILIIYKEMFKLQQQQNVRTENIFGKNFKTINYGNGTVSHCYNT